MASLKLILFITFTLVSFPSVGAITIDDVGIIGGNSFSKFKNDSLPNSSITKNTNIYGTIYVNRYLNKHVGLQLELSFKKIGSKLEYNTSVYRGYITVEDNISISYLELPLLIKLPYFESQRSKLNILFGPFVGYVLNANRSGEMESSRATLFDDNVFSGSIPNTNNFQYGLTVGYDIGFVINNTKLLLALRYNYYGSKLFKETSEEYLFKDGELPIYYTPNVGFFSFKNNQLSLGLGWCF